MKTTFLLLPLLALAAAPARAEDPATNAPVANSGIILDMWLLEIGWSNPAESGHDWVVRALFHENETAVPPGEKWHALFDGSADRILEAAMCDDNVRPRGAFRDYRCPNGSDAPPEYTMEPRLLFNVGRDSHDDRPAEDDGLLFSATTALQDDGSIDLSFSAGLPNENGRPDGLFKSAIRVPRGQTVLFGGAKDKSGRDLVLALSSRDWNREKTDSRIPVSTILATLSPATNASAASESHAESAETAENKPRADSAESAKEPAP